ncbi:hypothetical protein [Rhizobacter sp. Root16D2]|uniref:hypothetical protein n=1 Tax=Rhizobacter sp. Root16D2 TaxID=1736479 RepID=UPI0012F80BD5|nr:hypothetical protein [Rhizobacter sp. Root16D2]
MNSYFQMLRIYAAERPRLYRAGPHNSPRRFGELAGSDLAGTACRSKDRVRPVAVGRITLLDGLKAAAQGLPFAATGGRRAQMKAVGSSTALSSDFDVRLNAFGLEGRPDCAL